MSLRLRLTLLNGLVVLLTLGVFATVAYVTQYRLLISAVDSSLRTEARRFTEPSAAVIERTAGRLTRVAIFPSGRGFAARDVFIQISSPDGEIVARSRSLEESVLPIESDALERALAGDEWFTDVEVEDQLLRVFTAPIRNPGPGGPLGVVQVAQPLTPTLAGLHALRTTFATVGAASVLICIVVGWLLARAALSPIDRLAAAAHAIGAARDFRRRVELPQTGRRDEVGRLAAEFNDMLAQLQSAYEQLEVALAAQRRFVADASHELRTPITSLRGNLELLRRMPMPSDPEDPEGVAQLLADMTAETDRVSRLVSDLLLLARADAGQHLTLAPTEVGALVQEAFRSARFLREEVVLHLGEAPADLWVEAEPDKLKQLLLILLDNALKYTPDGGRVTLSAQAERRQGVDGVVIRVEDTGPGIPLSEQRRIFDRFYRVESARGPGGAGLGLAIARWIADEHHGTIGVQSAPGQGSVFSVWLPALPPPDSPQPTPAPASPRLVTVE